MNIDIRPIAQKYFTEDAPVNYKVATATLGDGDNGTITVYSPDVTDDVKIAIVVASAKSKPLSAALAEDKITVTLATTDDDTVTPDDTKNTATLIAAEISKISGYTAVASGTGETAIDTATEEDVAFEDGAWGVPCPEIGIGFKDTSYYYVCVDANNTKYNTGWRRFTLTEY